MSITVYVLCIEYAYFGVSSSVAVVTYVNAQPHNIIESSNKLL